MRKSVFLLLGLFAQFFVFGQIETTTINGKSYYVYPFQQEVRSNERYYYQFADQKEVLKRDDKNRKVVDVTHVELTKADKLQSNFGKFSKKDQKRMLDMLQHDFSTMTEYDNNLMKDITPALEALPDGEYVQFFRDIPFIENRVVRYKNDVVAGFFSIKNNTITGASKWFLPDGKIARLGEYQNGMKQNAWKKFEYNENYFLSTYSETDNYSTVMSKMVFDTIINTLTFKNGVRDGICTTHKNQQLINSGAYTNDVESGTWKIYGLKTVKKQDEKGKWYTYSEKNDYILLENYTYRTDKKRGKGLIFRSEVVHPEFKYSYRKDLFFEDTNLRYYGRSEFPNFRYNYSFTENEDDMELPEEYYESYEGGEMMGEYMEDYEMDPFYGMIEDSTYSAYDQYEIIDGKNFRVNHLIDSLGYLYKFEGVYEHYYQNGQLKYRFEIVDGKLIEETPVYWDNGKIANEVVFVTDSNRYEQRFYDYYGKNYLTIKYDSKGFVIKEQLRETEDYVVINNKKYLKNFGKPNFLLEENELLKKGVTEKTLVYEKLWKEDSTLAATAYFDPISKTLEVSEKNFAGENYLKSETIFADDYSSLTSSKTVQYKNIQFDVVSSGTYQDFYGFDYMMPNMKDSISPQSRILGWYYRYKIDSDVIVKVDNMPFTGNYKATVNKRNFKVSANTKEISITTPTSIRDEKIYKKDIKRFKKTKVASDFVKAYFPEYGGMDNVSTGIFSLFQFDPNIRTYNSNNYYLDTNLYNEVSNEEYLDMEYMLEEEEENIRNNHHKKDKSSQPVALYGKYFNGKQEGLWALKDQYGKTLIDYQFKAGELHGSFNLYSVAYPLKKRKTEEFEYDYMEERLPVYLQDPKPKKKTYFLERTANFNNGKIDGYLYHFNWLGDTLECEKFVDGVQSGLSYKRNKLFYTETMYEEGSIDGITRTYLTELGKDSVLLFELNFQNGSLQGKSVAYHANGRIAKKGFFLNGLPIDDFEAFDTLGFRYQYVKFQYNQPIEEKIWEENQLSIKYEFDWRDSIPFNTEDITSATSIESLLYQMGFDDGSLRRPYYGRPSLVDKTGITYTLTKYYPNDTIARFGMIEKGKKVGCWEYFSYDGLKLMEVDYFDTLITRFDSIKFKSKGVLTYVDSNGVELSKSYIIEKIEKYDCSHSDHHEERMLYCFWEKDTLQHRINGYVKNRYDNGALQNEGYVKDGMPVGIWKLYDSNGNLNQVGVYKNGKRDGRWIKGDLGSVKNMSEICLNPNLDNLEAILNYEEKLLDISVIYYSVGKEIRREYYGINMNNEEAPDGYYGEEDYYEGEEEYYEEGY